MRLYASFCFIVVGFVVGIRLLCILTYIVVVLVVIVVMPLRSRYETRSPRFTPHPPPIAPSPAHFLSFSISFPLFLGKRFDALSECFAARR